MSFVVTGTDLPKCCQNCPIYDHEFGCCNLISDSRYYDKDGAELYDPFTEKHKDCPLKEIKEELPLKWENCSRPGYWTPGGDPVVRCPKCKSPGSEPVQGIESPWPWNYCPICGIPLKD